MITPCVLDTSAAVKVALREDGATDVARIINLYGRQQQGPHISVPDLFFIESANVFWQAVRKGALTRDNAHAHLQGLLHMGFSVVSTSELADSALLLAGEHNISAYDACYVALAAALDAPLITADTRLIRALAATPYRLVTPEAFRPEG
jgi:predicted nucleic acid-binding protein